MNDPLDELAHAHRTRSEQPVQLDYRHMISPPTPHPYTHEGTFGKFFKIGAGLGAGYLLIILAVVTLIMVGSCIIILLIAAAASA